MKVFYFNLSTYDNYRTSSDNIINIYITNTESLLIFIKKLNFANIY